MKSNIYTKKNSYTSKNPQSFPNEMMVKIFCSNNYSNFKFKSPSKNKILDFVISLSNKNDISQYG